LIVGIIVLYIQSHVPMNLSFRYEGHYRLQKITSKVTSLLPSTDVTWWKGGSGRQEPFS
jgi:hypothetical protein